MACRDAYNKKITAPVAASRAISRLLFGVNSAVQANDLLQNNLTEFEWVRRNKVYPNFWGRNINGENALTEGEIRFLHCKGCKIAAIWLSTGPKKTEDQGRLEAKRATATAMKLNIPRGTAIFMEIPEEEVAATKYLFGFAAGLLREGYTPGFKANTDAAWTFDREFSRGVQIQPDTFRRCLIWAVAPSLKEYDRITTTHLIHPDNWKPFAPSGTTRNDIAIWQYGKDCHPILDDEGRPTCFHLDLVRNDRIITEKMF